VTKKKRFITLSPKINVIKPFAAVIYSHSMAKLSCCVIKLYNLGTYRVMALNYHGNITTFIKHNLS